MQTTKTSKSLSGYVIPSSLKPLACLGLVLSGACLLFPKPTSLQAAVPCPGLSTQSQAAYTALSQDIRAAKSVDQFEPNRLVLASAAGDITYSFNEADHTLTRTSAGSSQKLLTGVDTLSFSLLHRAGPGAPLGTLVPSTVEDARAVACRWSCSRTMAGAKLDSGNFHMAPVLIHNR